MSPSPASPSASCRPWYRVCPDAHDGYPKQTITGTTEPATAIARSRKNQHLHQNQNQKKEQQCQHQMLAIAILAEESSDRIATARTAAAKSARLMLPPWSVYGAAYYGTECRNTLFN